MKVIITNPIYGIQPTIDSFHLFGVWLLKDSSIFYKVFMNINIIWGVIYMFTIIGSLFQITSLDNSADKMFYACSELVLLIKLSYLLVRRKEIDKLLEALQKYLILDSDDKEEKRMISEGIMLSRRIFFSMRFIFISGSMFACTIPFFQKEKTLIYPSVFPFDPMRNQTTYVLICVYQAFGIFIQMQWNAAVDTMPSSILAILGGFYDALGYNLSKIGCYGEKEGTIQHKNIEKTASDYEMEEKRLKLLIEKYKNITRITAMIENIYSEMIFCQFCLGGIILCTSAFQLSLLSFRADLAKCVFSLVFIVSMTTQFFIPCYFGNEIILKSEFLLNQIYHSNWFQGSPKLKKDIYIFMERLKRSTRISAGRIFFLSLQSFTSIINFAYSAYTVLRRVH